MITPSLDYNTALDTARVDRIEPWNDGVGREWREHLPAALQGHPCIAIEFGQMLPKVRAVVDELTQTQSIADITPLVSAMRMIKSPEELQLARYAGEVAMEMMQAGHDTIAHGVPEYSHVAQHPLYFRSWRRAGRSPALITVHQTESCSTVNRFSSVFAV